VVVGPHAASAASNISPAITALTGIDQNLCALGILVTLLKVPT
jgi:hypothetical protein